MAPDTIYDHPLYYDILFGWDRSREADFYHAVLLRSGVAAGERILEVACGTGQVGLRLARRGWKVTGLDVRPAMIAFLRERAAMESVPIDALCADMMAFEAASPFAAAYNPMSSFRLLERDAGVDAHLRSVAAALRPGAVYVLDIELSPSLEQPAPTTSESWEMTREGTTVRAENEAVHVSDGGVERVLAWGREGHLRAYTPASFARRIAASGAFQIASWHPEWRGADGVGEFRVESEARSPGAGRGIVVLRRREQPNPLSR